MGLVEIVTDAEERSLQSVSEDMAFLTDVMVKPDEDEWRDIARALANALLIVAPKGQCRCVLPRHASPHVVDLALATYVQRITGGEPLAERAPEEPPRARPLFGERWLP